MKVTRCTETASESVAERVRVKTSEGVVYRNSMSEAVLMQSLIDFAQQLGFLTAHIPDKLYSLAASQGRYDALSGAEGLPDIIAVGHGHLLILECKTETGRVSHTQLDWLDAFAGVSSDCVHVRVVRPADYDDVIDLMRRCREEGWAA